MEWVWIIIWLILICVWTFIIHRRSYNRGYERGAQSVLKQWKQTLRESEDLTDEA